MGHRAHRAAVHEASGVSGGWLRSHSRTSGQPCAGDMYRDYASASRAAAAARWQHLRSSAERCLSDSGGQREHGAAPPLPTARTMHTGARYGQWGAVGPRWRRLRCPLLAEAERGPQWEQRRGARCTPLKRPPPHTHWAGCDWRRCPPPPYRCVFLRAAMPRDRITEDLLLWAKERARRGDSRTGGEEGHGEHSGGVEIDEGGVGGCV